MTTAIGPSITRLPSCSNKEVACEAEFAVVDVAGARAGACWHRVDQASARVAVDLRDQGVGPDSVLLVDGHTDLTTCIAVLSAWLCGAAVSVLPGDLAPDVHAEEVDRRVRLLEGRRVYRAAAPGAATPVANRNGVTALVGLPPVDAALSDDAEAGKQPVNAWPPSPVGWDDICIYQATSGTTGQPQLVPVTWRMLVHNIDGLATRLGLTSQDRCASWLPLFHDLGFIGTFGLATYLRMSLTLLAPRQFVLAPLRFAEIVEDTAATYTASPTFGLALLGRALGRASSTFRLGSMKYVVCGGEFIDLDVCEAFVESGRRHGLAENVICHGYGMAEATLAVSARPPSNLSDAQARPPEMREGETPRSWHSPSLRFARLGPPLPGTEVRLCSPAGDERVRMPGVGELEVSGPNVMASYVGVDGTCEPRHGWVKTGDIGYLDDGEVVVVGRTKDILVVGGRNLLPEDAERVVSGLEGVRRGRVVAIPLATSHGESFGVIAERSTRSVVTEQEVRSVLRKRLGVAPHAVLFVGKGEVLKTTSGKLRRRACLERFGPALSNEEEGKQ